MVDFETISGISGVFLVNTVENGIAVASGKEDKAIVTKITFDYGRTFTDMKAGDDKLHLHSIAELDQIGRYMYSGSDLGQVMGNGNIGHSLGQFADANLYVSDDAGLKWKKALDGPHLFEFGDSGSIMIAVTDSRNASVKGYSYSLDHGDNWKSVALPKELTLQPNGIITVQDSSSLKFLLLGKTDDAYYTIAIDFKGLKKRTCKDKDFEDWHPRIDQYGKSACLMGHKQTYRRRKKSADCFVGDTLKDQAPKTEDCECTDADFECDCNFQKDSENADKCTQIGPILSLDDECKKSPDGKVERPSGWRLIPGNTCKRTSGKQRDDKIIHICGQALTSAEAAVEWPEL
jgi:hypothetical protein